MSSEFESFKLVEPLVLTLKKVGYTTPTPIQAQAIPHLLKGKDLLGIAQTGTGKTAAFCLPILNRLALKPLSPVPTRIRVLILTPTRELALQTLAKVRTYGKDVGVRAAAIYGGVNEHSQIKAMQKGVDILAATPGRFLDLMNRRFIHVDRLEVFVLDEADRMLDMGFIHDVRKIIAKLPPNRQTLLFSATMPQDITQLANKLLKQPVRVEVTPQATTVQCVVQKLIHIKREHKLRLLKAVLEGEQIHRVLVFTRTKHGANRLVYNLAKFNILSDAIHGNKSQSARVKALESFRSGKLKILIATDIAARGIDIPMISHVINYDLPNEPESYVHRIGRTARAGQDGIAISFCDDTQKALLRAVEKVIRNKIPVIEAPRY